MRNYNIFFSIVMPIYQKKNYLSRSIHSVLSQSFTQFELLCIDDGSTDGGLDIIEKINDSRIRIFKKSNQGISAAKNFGIMQSKHSLIAFIDADDEWNKDYLLEISLLICRFSEASAYVSAYQRKVGDKANLVHIPELADQGYIIDYFKARLFDWGVHTSSVVLNKAVTISIGAFPLLLFSNKLKKGWLTDFNGKIISVFNDFYSTSRFNSVDLNYIVVPIELLTVEDLSIEIPGAYAEDQFLHDLFALRSRYAYTNKVLSTWYGDIPNQATTKTNSAIFSHIIGINKHILDNEIGLHPASYLSLYLKYIGLSATHLIFKSKMRYELINKHNLKFIWNTNREFFMFMQLFLWKIFFKIHKLQHFLINKFNRFYNFWIN